MMWKLLPMQMVLMETQVLSVMIVMKLSHGRKIMLVTDLIRILGQCNPNAEVRVIEDVDDGNPNYWVAQVDEREDEVLLIGKE